MTSARLVWDACPKSVREHAALRSIAAYVANPKVRQRLAEGQHRGEYPEEVLAELQGLGLASLFGPEATPWHLCALSAELAAADGSLAITVGVNGLALLPVHLDGRAQLRERVFEQVTAGEMGAMLLTEWAHGSDLVANETRARRVEGRIRIDGNKALINGGSRHRLLTILARTRDRDLSEPGARRAALGDHTLLWAERDATVDAVARHPTLSARGADISRVDLRGTTVADDAIIGREGDGFAVVRRTLTVSRGGIAALAAGAVAAVHAIALGYAHDRVIYGHPIATLDAIADHVAELAELEAQCAAVSLRATAFVNGFGVEAAPHTAAAKLVAPRLAERACDVARRVLGSRALLEDHDLARFVRDVPLYGIFDGTQHVMLEELGFGLDRLSRGRRLDPDDPIERARHAWTAPPRTLQAIGESRDRLRPIDPRRHAERLAELATWSWVGALPGLATRLVSLHAELAEHATQTVRFDAAEALAWLEVCFGCIELGDPGVVGLVRGPGPALDVLALEAGGCRRACELVSRLRALSLAAGLATAEVDSVEGRLHQRSATLRRALVDRVSSCR